MSYEQPDAAPNGISYSAQGGNDETTGLHSVPNEPKQSHWESVGWTYDAWDSFAWACALMDAQSRGPRILAAFGDGDTSNPKLAARQAFISLMHSYATDHKDNEALKKQEVVDRVRRETEARETVAEERRRRQIAGELSPQAQEFLDHLMSEDGVVDIHKLSARKRSEPLIEGLLFKNSLAWLAGESNTYKSFLSLDIALRLAKGIEYHQQDMPMTKGRSLIILAEGADDYEPRALAWEKRHGLVEEGMVNVYGDALQLSDLDVQMPALLKHIKDEAAAERPYDLIIFDTQAMCTVGVKENDNTEMGEIIYTMHQIRKETAACVMLIHHFGGDKSGMRGATAIYGAATTVIAVKPKGDLMVTLSTKRTQGGKQKNAEALGGIVMELEKVSGDGWSSLVPRRSGWVAEDAQALDLLARDEHAILTALIDVDSLGGAGTTHLAREVQELIGDNPRSGSAWKANHIDKLCAKLKEKGFADKQGSKYTITGKGREAHEDGITDSGD